jgi:hypothetical protein
LRQLRVGFFRPQRPTERFAMILGMPIATYTFIHVLISLIGIVSGLVILYGMLKNNPMNRLTAIFLITTALTSITGFGFPFTGVTPAIKLGVLSLIVLAVAALARYALHMKSTWRKMYAVAASVALYFNVFVLVVQSFEKIPALHTLAPTQKEPPFAVAQLVVLVVFVALTILAAKRFRGESTSFVKSAGKAA